MTIALSLRGTVTTIYQTPVLTLYAANQVFSAMPPQNVFVGTTPPSDHCGAVVRYQHPIDFGVHFRANSQGDWFASVTRNVRHLHLSPRSVIESLKATSTFTPAVPSIQWLPLESGLHVFLYGNDSDQFQASVSGKAVLLDGGMLVEFKSDAQRMREEEAIFFAKRIEMAATPQDVDEHNLAVLEEDLKDLLARPRTKRGNAELFNRFEAAFNGETGKLIALLPVDLLSRRAHWPSSASSYTIIMDSMTFSTSRRALDRPLDTDTEGHFRLKPLPKSLEKAIALFNDRFEEKA